MHPILEEIRSLDTGRQALRSFGRLVGGALLVLAVVVLWRAGWNGGPAVYGLAGTGVALITLAYAWPVVLGPVYRVWMALAVVLGYVMTRVLLTLVFYLAITPIGLVLRLMGKDLLDRKIEPEATTYWQKKEYEDDSPGRLEKYY